MALNATWNTAPVIWEELPIPVITYGQTYFNSMSLSLMRVKTTTTIGRYKICFLTKLAAETGLTSLTSDFNDARSADPAINNTAKATRAYKCNGYDIEVTMCEIRSVEEAVG